MVTLTTNQLCELADFSTSSLNRFVEAGVITPAIHNGEGRGNQREFSLPQATGILLARTFQSVGWKAAAVVPIVEYIANLSEEEIETQIASGRTVLLQPPLLKALDPLWGDPVELMANAKRDARRVLAAMDIKAAYERVLEAATSVEV